ncbi:protein of unknown function [Lactiplantibacillus plantarum]
MVLLHLPSTVSKSLFAVIVGNITLIKNDQSKNCAFIEGAIFN